jgi:hypothetical protein
MNETLTSQEALLFQAALGIQSPWYITNITLNQETHELHIYLDFEKEVNSLVQSAIRSVAATIPKIKHGGIFLSLNIQRFCMPVHPESLAKKMASIASKFPGLEKEADLPF